MPGAPDSFSNLTLWVEADSLTASDGDVIDPWLEAGTITIGSADDLAGDGAFTPNVAGTYQTNELCSNSPTIQFDSSNRGYASATRVGLAYGTSAPAIFNDLGQFSVAAIGRIASGTDTGAELQLIQTDVVWLRIHNFGDGTGEVRLRINQNAAFQTRNFTWPYIIGDWVFIAVRWDGTTVKAKVNNDTEQTASFSSPLQSTELGAGAPIKIGFDSDPVDQVGQVVMVAAWSYYLDNTDVPALINYVKAKYSCLDVCSWYPSTISNLTLWVEANTLSAYYANGDPVNPWYEAGAITINGVDDLVVTGNSPTWRATDGPCGEAVVRFGNGAALGTSTRQFRSGTPGENDSIAGDQGTTELTYIAVARVASWGSSSDVFYVVYNPSFQVYFEQVGGNTFLKIHAEPLNGSDPNVDLSWSYTVGDWVVIKVRYGSSTLTASVNTVVQSGTLVGEFRVDDATLENFMFLGGVGEVVLQVFYSRRLTNVEYADIKSYFSCRYPCLDFSGDDGADIRLRTTQFMRIGAGVGI